MIDWQIIDDQSRDKEVPKPSCTAHRRATSPPLWRFGRVHPLSDTEGRYGIQKEMRQNSPPLIHSPSSMMCILQTLLQTGSNNQRARDHLSPVPKVITTH